MTESSRPISSENESAASRPATFYLGSHMVSPRWWQLGIPLFVSVNRLRQRRSLPVAVAPWGLDSGGFTELDKSGRWSTSEDQYVSEVERLREIGNLAWVAPQDWMCEPFILAKTGLTVRDHQERTVESFLSLRERVGPLVIPVLQGYAPREYDRCVALYQDAGVDLAAEPVVGLGSVCRRSRTIEVVRLVRYLGDHGLRLHGFGLKGDTFRALRYELTSADSMAWSYRGRREPGCSPSHKSEANCLRYAMRWRKELIAA